MKKITLEPVTLESSSVKLIPLSPVHTADLQEAVLDGGLHRLWYTMIPSVDGVPEEIERRLALHSSGSMIPFSVFYKPMKKVVGMTTYMNIDIDNKRIEIGSTWYRQQVQKTTLNTEAKLLLLKHAFEIFNCNVVEFRTHFINHQSRRAIERLGAKFDGVIRAHLIMKNGTIRDTAIYSILRSEWPSVEANLNWLIEKYM